MKAFAVWILTCALLLGAVGCMGQKSRSSEQELPVAITEESEPVNTAPEVRSFSYEEVKKQFWEDTPGVKTDGFRNVTQCVVTHEEDAVERAKAECTVKYDFVRVRYDGVADIWEVCFLANHPGGGQDVYLNSKGLTQLIVYGE